MSVPSRRRFLGHLGHGMVAASVGVSLATDWLGRATFAEDAPERLDFGRHRPLVDLLLESTPEQTLTRVATKLREGTSLRDVVAAAALANASAFGGEDYIGFHTLMALGPTLDLAQQFPSELAAWPVLKVLYRNAARLADTGLAAHPTLAPVIPSAQPHGETSAARLRELVRGRDITAAESTFAANARRSSQSALDEALTVVEDGAEVHRVVLVHRAWDMVSLVGEDMAETLLRQSLRYCVKNEEHSAKNFADLRAILPKTIDAHRLEGRAPGDRPMDEQTLLKFVDTLFTSTAEQAADAAGAALAEGFAPDAIAEAVSLCANQLLLRDEGRLPQWAQPNKPPGSVHGDSIGVHASDSANAWRNIARYGGPRHAIAATILASYQVARDRQWRAEEFAKWDPRPSVESLAGLTPTDQPRALEAVNEAIRGKNQEVACAATHSYLAQGHDVAALWSTFARFAVGSDGALHGEKFYRTAREEFAGTRAAVRNRQLIGLARVSASAYGYEAPGLAAAKEALESPG